MTQSYSRLNNNKIISSNNHKLINILSTYSHFDKGVYLGARPILRSSQEWLSILSNYSYFDKGVYLGAGLSRDHPGTG